ncbi:alpha/beta hydrolase domain-containing protein [Peribacillus glennii]|uniref:alpha/beta hydrolase domain-containing protein n=1 Tax=Peribacillus glennii TaxID=2303991 RepID=UPI00268D29D9
MILFSPGEVAARQDDSDVLRTWEVAGTSHIGYHSCDYRLGLLDQMTYPYRT